MIEGFINYYIYNAKGHLRTLVRADQSKYRSLLKQNLVIIPEHLTTD